MKNIIFKLSVVYLVMLLLVAIFGVRFPIDETVGEKLLPPNTKFWCGTDELGRDVFSRLAYGARLSIGIGFAVTVFALIVAFFIGTAAGYGPRWLGNALMRFTDGMFAFPDILLAILIIGIIGVGHTNIFSKLPNWMGAMIPVFAALAVVAWPSTARLVRNQVLSIKEREYVTASRALGAGHWHVVAKHILPQLWGLISAVAMVEMAQIILAESALSFLGIGIQPPWPSWGSMINDSRAWMASEPLLLLWPCLALSLTILALNFVGDSLRDKFDPKTAKT